MTFTNTVEIPFGRVKTDAYFQIRGVADYALEMVKWCRDRDLIIDQDFVWKLDTQREQIVFSFSDSKKSFASMLLLVFGVGNV